MCSEDINLGMMNQEEREQHRWLVRKLGYWEANKAILRAISARLDMDRMALAENKRMEERNT